MSDAWTPERMREVFEQVKNWGRWGADDEMGAQKPGSPGYENPHLDSYSPLGLTARRPTEWYSKPSSFMVSGR